jgi:hypothetical protein
MADGLSQWAEDVHLDDNQASLTLRTEFNIPDITRYLVEQGANVFAITPHRASLEEVFIQTVGEDGGL